MVTRQAAADRCASSFRHIGSAGGAQAGAPRGDASVSCAVARRKSTRGRGCL